MRQTTLLILAISLTLCIAAGVGCKKEQNPPPDTSKTQPEASTEANPETPTEPETKPAPKVPEEPLNPDEEDLKEVEELLRAYFDHLTHQRPDEARAMLLGDDEACRTVFTEPNACTSVGKGQAEAMELLAKDPVPFNSKIIECLPGTKQMLDEKKGAKAPTALWLGSSIRARGPTGYEFLMRSLGVVETGLGKRIMWGKRRAFGDTPRNPSPIAIEPPTP
jgi:hypothetical protein